MVVLVHLSPPPFSIGRLDSGSVITKGLLVVELNRNVQVSEELKSFRFYRDVQKANRSPLRQLFNCVFGLNYTPAR